LLLSDLVNGSSTAISSTARQVLLVEDDADVREALAAALGRCGYSVTTACNGRDAIDHLARSTEQPSLIVLDWMMPVMNGLDFLTHQAANPRLRATPVLILSAVDRVHNFAGATVAAVLTKPVRMRTLIDVIDRLCGMPRRPEGFLAAQITGRVSAPRADGSVVTRPRPDAHTVAIRRGTTKT
jgi:CheY-like chemotaxis protein